MPKPLKELSNIQIDKKCQNNPNYGGCYSKDQLPKPLSNKFYVVNMQDHNAGNGTHWVLLFNCKPNIVIYFDSMGEGTPPTQIAKAMKSTGKKPQYNTTEMQTLGSSSCGWWCLACAKYLLQPNSTLPKFIQHFSIVPAENEHLLQHIV